MLALGVRFGLFTMGVSNRLVPSDAKLIHVEVDAKEIGQLRDAHVAIVADSRETRADERAPEGPEVGADYHRSGRT